VRGDGVDETWEVFGGNGASYGDYVTLDQAKGKAMNVVTDPWLTNHLLHCP